MAHVKVKVKIGDTSANGLYKQDSSTVWSQVSPNNNYKLISHATSGVWRLIFDPSGSNIVKKRQQERKTLILKMQLGRITR